MASLNPDQSLPSADFRIRRDDISNNYEALVNNLDTLAVLGEMMRRLPEERSSKLRKLGNGEPCPQDIVQEVEQNIPSLFTVFTESVKAIHGDLLDRLHWQGGLRTTSSPDSSGFFSSGGEAAPSTSSGGDSGPQPSVYGDRINCKSDDSGSLYMKEVRSIEDLRDAANKSINLLKLDDIDINDEHGETICWQLKRQPQLTGLHLNGRNLSVNSAFAVLENLHNTPSLQQFSLHGTRFSENCTNELISFLRKIKGLNQLSLDHCRFAPTYWTQIAKAIGGIKLEYLSVNDTLIGDEGMGILSEALQENACLKVLSLTRNQLSDVSMESIARCIANKKDLGKLSLESNQITNIEEILKKLVVQNERTPCVFNMADNQIGEIGDEANWKNINIEKHTFNFDSNQIKVESAQGKENITIHGNKIGKERVDVLVKRISRGETFRIINLAGMDLTSADIETLCLLLCCQGNLEKIYLRNNKLDGDCLPVLIQLYHRCQNLVEVNLVDNPNISDCPVESFAEELRDFREGKIDPPFLFNEKFWEIIENSFQNGIHINKTHLDGHDVKVLFKILEGEQIREIKFVDTQLAIEECIVICKHAFLKPAGTETLVLSKNCLNLNDVTNLIASIFPKGAIPLPMSKRMVKSKELVLSKFVLTDNGVTDEGIRIITETIFKCRFLTHVNLANNRIQTVGCRILAKFIAEHSALLSLSLAGNDIMYQGLSALQKALVKNISLKHLNLEKNKINSQGISVIAEIVEKNECLEYLDLSGNELGLGKPEFPKLVERLEKNKTLRTLRLRNNSLNDGHIKGMAKKLSDIGKEFSKSTKKEPKTGNEESGEDKDRRPRLSIDISKNKMQKDSLSHMLTAMKSGLLERLDISECDYDINSSIEVLCNSLPTKELLPIYIGLRKTRINDDTIIKFAQSLSTISEVSSSESAVETIVDLIGARMRKETPKELIRINHHTPRCIFRTEGIDYFDSPFLIE